LASAKVNYRPGIKYFLSILKGEEMKFNLKGLLFVTIFVLVFTVGCAANSTNTMYRFVSCPQSSKLTGTCVEKNATPEELLDGQVENIGLSGDGYRYAEISAPKGSYLYATTLGGTVDATGGGTKYITISLIGNGAADVQVKLTCNNPNIDQEITVKYYRQK
jgi:hypothetical protein